MTLKKQYLRYKQSGTNFGLVASPNVGIKFVKLKNKLDKYVAIAAGEYVFIYDSKTQINEIIIDGGTISHVSTFEVNFKIEPIIAIGYEDGSIKVFNYETKELKCSFIGHKTVVTSICFDNQGMRIASGSKDTDLAIWDIVSERGLFRLKGHKQRITHCLFMQKHDNILISSSTDALVKFWDLNTQHCFKTLFGHKSEIWSFVLTRQDRRLITGSTDLKVFKISFQGETEIDEVIEIDNNDMIDSDNENNQIIEEEEQSNLIKVKFIGSILRASKTRLVDLILDSSERLMMCNGNDNFIECFKLRNDEEIRMHFNKKMRKIKRKIQNDPATQIMYQEELQLNQISFKDEFQRLNSIQTNSIVKSISAQKFSVKTKITESLKESSNLINYKIACLLNNNNFELYEYDPTGDKRLVADFSSYGHRHFVNSLSISEDNFFILSSSKESVKIWNRITRKCINTIVLNESIICSTFVPGNRFCIVATKKGNLVVIDIGSSDVIDYYKASDRSITCIYNYPNGNGLVSGCDDKKVKFWNYKLITREKRKLLILELERILELDESVTCVRISENMKQLAVALLDSTVKIYFFDTLKFFLSLYGHKFPVRCMDISSDCTLIVTGSADKNVKIWGLDFGDCHKSIFSHDDTITAIQFVNKTHYYFTCSLDKTIKQWDSDTFEKILTLRGHESEVQYLCISNDSKFVLSSDKDFSMRIWEKTDEILVIEDELDVEREMEIVKKEFQTDETVIVGEINQETGLATRKNIETLKSTEKLIEAIDVYQDELLKIKEYELLCKKAEKSGKDMPIYQPNILFTVYKANSPDRYILEVIKSIKSSEIEECLFCLPFNYVTQLLLILSDLLDKNWEAELICRFSTLLARIHFGQIISNHKLAPTIGKLRNLSIEKMNTLREMVGLNLSALEYLSDQLFLKDEITLFTKVYANANEKRIKYNEKNDQNESVYLIGV